jgi:predicted nucleic acid-binding protein
VSSCVLDTDVVIAALDRRDPHHADAAKALTAMIDDGVDLLISLVNYAETLVRPAENDVSLRAAVDAIAALGIELVAPTSEVALDAARHRGLNISLADGFALATAQARHADIATFDRRVRRALPRTGLQLAPRMG